MAKTRTPSITVLADGGRFIDKRQLGVRIGLRAACRWRERDHDQSQSGSRADDLESRSPFLSRC
jgi:hypothetical protein